MGKGKTNAVGANNMSQIIVTCTTGSTVYITDSDGNRKDTNESGGKWTFRNLYPSTWTVHASKNSLSVETTVEIKEESQQIKYAVTLNYLTATITVTYPAGSTCTCTKDTTTIAAPDTSGTYTFSVHELGDWAVNCTDGTNNTSQTVTITQDGQAESVSLSYHLYASDFDWAAYGTKNVDYQIVDDSNTEIPESDWPTTVNWKARLLTSGTLKALKSDLIDVFVVGGGAGGADGGNYGGGGGSGYTTTQKNVELVAGTEYTISIGAGGGQNTKGGTTSAFDVSIAGGNPGSYNGGGSGGSGGGGAGSYQKNGGAGGSNGNAGTASTKGGGAGQGRTTREFGESSGNLYAGGGGGGGYNAYGPGGSGGGGKGGYTNVMGTSGTKNTGGGGGGTGGSGGSGIVVFRNAREVS